LIILAPGIDYSSLKLLVEPMGSQFFAQRLESSLVKNASFLKSISDPGTKAFEYRSILEQVPEPNKADPLAVYWTYLISNKDPLKDKIISTIRPLAEFREMIKPDEPLIFNDEQPDKWNDWFEQVYKKGDPMSEPPHYVLIIGTPELIPFDFQSFLGIAASVGRLDFSSPEEDFIASLQAYVEKLIRIENKANEGYASVKSDATIFAPDWGPKDPTHYSHFYMADPLANKIKSNFGFTTNTIMSINATKTKLKGSLMTSKSALIYTASHGIGDPKGKLKVQKKKNGSILCQPTGNEKQPEELAFTSDDVPANNVPFLEGSVVFQFACFGYGTPKVSTYNRWLDKNPKINSEENFVSALPKRLLAHPMGPIAYIGHVDLAWLHGFDDPNIPNLPAIEDTPWHARMGPFYKAIEVLLGKRNPVGRAMRTMSEQYLRYSTVFVDRATLAEEGIYPKNDSARKRLTDDFITFNDARNYLILGDPAARLIIGN
jgi:hypothetical protein